MGKWSLAWESLRNTPLVVWRTFVEQIFTLAVILTICGIFPFASIFCDCSIFVFAGFLCCICPWWKLFSGYCWGYLALLVVFSSDSGSCCYIGSSLLSQWVALPGPFRFVYWFPFDCLLCNISVSPLNKTLIAIHHPSARPLMLSSSSHWPWQKIKKRKLSVLYKLPSCLTHSSAFL